MRPLSAISFAAALVAVTAQAATVPEAPPEPGQSEPTPEERMERRFPQPVRVGFLVGLPVLDQRSSTIGRVRRVVRTPEGKIRLVVPYGGLLGFGGREIALPVEKVAMLGAHVAAVDMRRADFEMAPTWYSAADQVLGPDETIRVGLTRR